MCTVLLPPGVNPIAVNKYINIKTVQKGYRAHPASHFFPGGKAAEDWSLLPSSTDIYNVLS